MTTNVLNKYLNNQFQIIQFDENGVLCQNQTKVFFDINVKLVFELHPFFETIQYLLDHTVEEEFFEAVHFNDESIIADVVFHHSKLNNNGIPFVIIIDKTSYYNNIQSITQTKNEVSIKNALSQNQLIQLRAEQEIKNAFLASIAHDLKNPIHCIINLLHLINKKELTKEHCELYITIHNFTAHLNRLINDIYDVSAIETGSFNLKTEPFDLHQTLVNIKKNYKLIAKDKNIKFKLKCDAAVPKIIENDPNRLMQIMINLLDNAFKFTDLGQVTVSVLTNKAGNLLIIKIKDTGCGFDMNKRDLSKKFKNLQAHKNQGLGLGLSIVWHIIEQMEGTITYHSELGKGTQFEVNLPLSIVQNTTIEKPETKVFVKKELTTTYHILIVDDNEINKLILTKLLVSHGGFYVQIAKNGTEALKTLQNNNFDFVILDLYMPELSGFEIIEEIKSPTSTVLPQLKIIPMTGGVKEADKPKLNQHQLLDSILYKPFEADALFTEIYKHL